MRAHLRALAAHLEPLGYPVHLYRAEGARAEETPPVPFLVLGGSWSRGEDAPLCDSTETLDTTIRITGTASTTEGAGVVMDRVRLLLSPGGGWSSVPMEGRAVQVKRLRAEVDPMADPDLRLPNSDRHPGFGVDSYRLRSVPHETGGAP